jgi:hypothetical protein
MNLYQQQLQERKEAIREYRKAIFSIKPLLLAACTPVNKRIGSSMEEYNLPPDLNAKIHAIYEQFGTKYQGEDKRFRWTLGGMSNTSKYLAGYGIGYYGKNADKFYLYRFTQEQHNQIIEALNKAAVELEKE